ncbi:MAG: SH3 domain-containing protein [Leptospirales bacterium]|nr:SH3 domain-containing protein [Leptospirales bacterium]
MKIPARTNLLALLACGQIYGQDPRTRSISADGVRIRTEPSLSGNVIGSYNKGDTVIELERTHDLQTIDGRTAVWVKVIRACSNPGWVFGAFVAPENLGVDFAFSAAGAVERSNPTLAIAEYGEIIQNFPHAQRSEGCHGLYSASREAQYRMDLITCRLTANHANLTLAQFAEIIKAGVRTQNAPQLQTLLSCDFSIRTGPLQLQFLPSQGIAEVLKLFSENPADMENISVTPSEIRIEYVRQRGHFFRILVTEENGKLVWSSFCADC